MVFRGDRILSMQRAASQSAGPGLWEGVSGRVRPGEHPLDAARREVHEETGRRVRVDPRPIASYAAQRKGEPMTVIVFRAEHHAGEVEISEEHAAFHWCTLDDLSELGVPRLLIEAARRAWPAG